MVLQMWSGPSLLCAAQPETTVQDWVPTSVDLKPLDVFTEPSGQNQTWCSSKEPGGFCVWTEPEYEDMMTSVFQELPDRVCAVGPEQLILVRISPQQVLTETFFPFRRKKWCDVLYASLWPLTSTRSTTLRSGGPGSVLGLTGSSLCATGYWACSVRPIPPPPRSLGANTRSSEEFWGNLCTVSRLIELAASCRQCVHCGSCTMLGFMRPELREEFCAI